MLRVIRCSKVRVSKKKEDKEKGENNEHVWPRNISGWSDCDNIADAPSGGNNLSRN